MRFTRSTAGRVFTKTNCVRVFVYVFFFGAGDTRMHTYPMHVARMHVARMHVARMHVARMQIHMVCRCEPRNVPLLSIPEKQLQSPHESSRRSFGDARAAAVRQRLLTTCITILSRDGAFFLGGGAMELASYWSPPAIFTLFACMS